MNARVNKPHYEQPLLYIAGQWREGRSGRSLAVLNPADESTLAELPVADPEDIDEAIAAAQAAFDRAGAGPAPSSAPRSCAAPPR